MKLDLVRLVAGWLAHPSHGVNALRTAVPRETGVPAPPAVTLYHEASNAPVARGQLPDALPALVVATPPDGAIVARASGIRPSPPDTDLDLHVRYATTTNDAKNTPAAAEESGLIMLAVLWSLGRLVTHPDGEAARVRNAIQLLSWKDYRLEDYQPNDDNRITAVLTATFVVRTPTIHS